MNELIITFVLVTLGVFALTVLTERILIPILRSHKAGQKILAYIHAHYCEPINVQSVAEVLGLNSNYFSKLFKQNTGTSPMQYINVLKVNRAKFLLKNTDMQVSEISSVIGYNDPFYFSRMFKREEKTSPLNYRYSD